MILTKRKEEGILNEINNIYIYESDLKEGEVICRKCNGKGRVGPFRNICMKCRGTGIVDWVTQAIDRPIIYADSSGFIYTKLIKL